MWNINLSTQRSYRSSYSWRQANYVLVIMMLLLLVMGVLLLHSYDQEIRSVAETQVLRIILISLLASVVIFIPFDWWRHLAYPLYGLSLCLLWMTAYWGKSVNGAQRWLDLGLIDLQTSETMKIALIFALARYFSGLSEAKTKQWRVLFVPCLLILAPAMLIFKQPDLGTTLLLVLGSGALMFIAGVSLWFFSLVLVSLVVSFPLAWSFLYPHQKERILVLLGVEQDPNALWQIQNAYRALGLGGFSGRGYKEGTYNQLGYVAENQTDFIYAILAEEFGFLGGVILLSTFMVLFAAGLYTAIRSFDPFRKLLLSALVINLFLYMGINLLMVLGIAPVVGVPLPFISYGGTMLLVGILSVAIMFSASLQIERES